MMANESSSKADLRPITATPFAPARALVQPLCRNLRLVCWTLLALALLTGGPAHAARPWPDTSFRIVPFADQLPNSMTETQRWFAATKFAGTQKMLRSEIRQLRAYNTNFLCLHYQLAVGCGSAAFIDGDAWVSDWTYVNAQTNWFLRNAAGQRVHQTEWNWDLMDVRYTNSAPVTGFPAYWISTCLARIRAAEDDGVFADSYTPDAYGFGASNPSHPWLEDVDLCRANWVPNLEQFGRAARLAMEGTNGFLFLPNLGGLVTGWLDMDYGLGQGGMIEGFGFWGPENYFDPVDWALQMDRTLALVRSNKVLICQSYPGAGNATERMFATASYLLVKGSATYLNLLSTDAVALEYYPEYTLDLGGSRGAVPAGIDALWNAAWGVYRRDYTNGIALVNPSDAPVVIPNLGARYWRATTSGGGLVSGSGSYSGTVTLTAVTNLTLPAFSGAVLMTTNTFDPGTNTSLSQPTNVRAFHRSGQTFITWAERTELTGESYRIYRHTQPITAANLASATRLYEVWEGSADFHANRYANESGNFTVRYLDRVVVTNGGTQLPAGTGVLVWTLATNDFAGGTNGAGYYAVTTVDSAGTENLTAFGSTNTVGAVTESVAEPLPVKAAVAVGARGHLYLQFMDLRQWNPTFHAPNAVNGYYGLNADLPSVQHSLAYAYDYVIFEPECATGPVPVVFSLHGWGGNTYGPVTTDPDPWGWCAYKIYPVDQNETWWFGFARNHDYRAGTEVAAGDTIVNFTEQRLLQMLRGLQRQPTGLATDTNRVFVFGQSMGGSGTLALAMRYPNVFAAAYASEPMTDYATSGDGGGDSWRGDVEPKWGARALALPVRLDAPAGWADPIKRYNGTNVWAWQNHRANLTNRLADEIVPLGVGHGTNDMVIEWPTQARPFYGALNNARRCYGGVVNDANHTWLSFFGLPPNLWPNGSLIPFQGFSVVRNETVPGFANASGNGPLPPVATSEYNLNLEWSSSWDAWDGAPLDTTNVWQMSLRSLSGTQTVNLTPRRTQRFPKSPGLVATWTNTPVGSGTPVQTGTVTSDANGLFLLSGVTVSPGGNRIHLELGSGLSGRTFYVATNGNNANPGTFAQPWRTPGYASRQLTPGDTLIIRGGRYVLSVFDADILEPPSGTPSAPITIKGEEGARPVLAGRDNLYAGIILNGQSNIRLENLELTHDAQASGDARFFRDGIVIFGEPASSNIVLNALYVHHLDQFGLAAQDVDHLTVTNCQFEYCGFGGLGGPAGTHGGWRNVTVANCRLAYSGHYYQGGNGSTRPYDRPDGFGIEAALGPVEIVDTVAEHNFGDGLDSKAARTTIRRCVVANNTCDGVKLWDGGCRVENTVIYGRGDGDASPTPWACVVFGRSAPTLTDFTFVNVTVDDFHGGSYLFYCNYDQPTEPLQVTMRNCIFRCLDSPIWINPASTLTADHNLFYAPNRPNQVLIHGATTYTSATIASFGTGNQYGNPLFVAPAWGATGNYHLQSNSPAINLGALTGAPTDDLEGHARDAQPDAGAYECVGCGVTPSAHIAVTPASLDFGSVMVGQTRDLNFSVSNSGNASLVGVASVSAPFSVVANASYSVPAGASTNVTVRFTPVSATSVTNLITFTGGGGAVNSVRGMGLLDSGQNDLVFIHHSSGQNWLDDGLDATLLAKDYVDERNDITYGTTMSPDAGRPASLGSVAGDNTDMEHWIRWFNDYAGRVRTFGCANGFNQIVMFKSCFPNSDIWDDGVEPGDPFSSDRTLANNRAIYRHPSGAGNSYSSGGYAYWPLEDIFAAHPDTLFIPVTAPPLHYAPDDATTDANAHRARVFNQWLKTDWLAAYDAAHPGLNNVAVFDWFNVLAYPDNDPSHPNRLRAEYGGTNGDSHPSLLANTTSVWVYATSPTNFLDAAWARFFSGTNGSAHIVVTPASLDFGSVVVGQTRDLNFSVSNSGNASLVGAASVSAPFTVVSNASYSVPAGASASVTVRFSPLSATSVTNLVTFTGGGGAANSVRGTGIPDTNGPSIGSLAALYRSGQTFLTWPERSDMTGEHYRLYRHSQPITANNLAAATLLYELPKGSAKFYATRYWSDVIGGWTNRNFQRYVITDRGSELPANTGLLVWTLATNDFSGGTGGAGYYAVTVVNASGVEFRSPLNSSNSIGPVVESMAEPLAVETKATAGVRGHVYIQYMDLRNWNPTFHAPNPRNSYLGLNPEDPAVSNAVQYAYDYTVYEPECAETPAPVYFNLHGWSGGYEPVTSDPEAYDWCSYKIYPSDLQETWFFGFARNCDYRRGEEPAAGDSVENFTEQRLLRMANDLIRHPPGAAVDTNRIYVWGQSMGGSGTLALALRYPNVFAAAYASEPMTDYRRSGDGGGDDWRGDVEWKWGAIALNLPVTNRGPGNWAAHLERFNGRGVWDWQNHQTNLATRLADEMVPFGVGHGTNDMVIEWPTQARPFYGVLNNARRCYGGVVSDAGHSWLGFWGLPPSIGPDMSLTPFRGFQVVRNETVPGLANASGNGPLPPVATSEYNLSLEWSSSWDAWDGVPLDTATVWQISLRSLAATNQTVALTPRRTQAFRVTPGAVATWQNRRVTDDFTIQSGSVTADAFGLLTVSNLVVSPDGNRLRLALATPPRITSVAPAGMALRLTFTTSTGHQYVVQRSPVLPAAAWANVSTNLPGTGAEVLFTYPGTLTNEAGFYRVWQAQ